MTEFFYYMDFGVEFNKIVIAKLILKKDLVRFINSNLLKYYKIIFQGITLFKPIKKKINTLANVKKKFWEFIYIFIPLLSKLKTYIDYILLITCNIFYW